MLDLGFVPEAGLSRLLSELGVRLEQQVVVDPLSHYHRDSEMVAVMGASVGALGTARAQYHLRQCFVFLDMPAVNQPEVMISAAASKFDPAGNLTDDTAKKLIGQLLANLCDLARRHGAGG